MNLVFAIGARYSHLVDAEWRADDRDHLVYMWRAVHLLQLQQMRTLTLHPEQRLIQVGIPKRSTHPSDLSRRLDFYRSTILQLATLASMFN